MSQVLLSFVGNTPLIWFLWVLGIFGLHALSKEDLVFFAIYCLFIFKILLVIEHKYKPYRPVYPVFCQQLKGFLKCGLRLQMDKRFYYEFQALSIHSRIVYIILDYAVV